MIELNAVEHTSDSDETILLVVHKHWVSFIGDALVFLVSGIVISSLLLVFRNASLSTANLLAGAIVTFLVPLSFLIIWTVLALVWTNYYLDMLVVSDRRVFYTSQVNFVQRTIRQWQIADIKHATVRFGNLIESFFNFGSLELAVAGERGVVRISGVPDPEYIAAIVLKQDDRYGALKETARKQLELLHFLSHEVKAHLTKSKAAFAAIVEGDYGAVPEQLHSMAGQALADSERGVQTVMSILDPSKQESGGGMMKIESKVFDLSETVRRIVKELTPEAAQKHLALHATVADFCIVRGDEQKIERHVIRNLIDNAIRYTPQGEVKVTLEKTPQGIRFSVADTGVGIAAADMQKLFTEGGRGARSRDVNPESTGYGLYIAKEVAGAHGGHIWARSAGPGSGSTFSLELPAAK